MTTTVSQEAREVGARYDDMAYAKSIVEAVEQCCTYEDRCLAVRDLLARHRQQAELAFDERERKLRKFNLGDRVTKTKGSSWTGLVVGFYSTSLTPIGYAVESENEPGSVQIYPESALEPKP